MILDWEQVLTELQAFQIGSLRWAELGSLTVDTLYGSMYGLNHRYMSVEDCLRKDFSGMLSYTIRRIQRLVDMPPVTVRSRPIPRIRQIGYGTYRWDYNPKLIRWAGERGLLIDTAEGYGFGRVETALGKFIKGIPNINITTKVRRDHMSPQALVSAAMRSRDKLGIVPHYQLHFPNDKYSDEQIGTALVTLRRRGIIASIGLGNCSVDMIESMQGFLSTYSGDVIRSVQIRFNLMGRRIERALLPYCQERGIVVLAYSPLGQNFQQFKKPVLDKIAKRYNATPAQVALACLLEYPGVIPIPQTNNLQHLQENIEALQLQLQPKDVLEINRAYAGDNIG